MVNGKVEFTLTHVTLSANSKSTFMTFMIFFTFQYVLYKPAVHTIEKKKKMIVTENDTSY